ncbi:MAG: penicillin-binding transpeptidase domain-containing protein, partial [Patescibacteria group bacterium]
RPYDMAEAFGVFANDGVKEPLVAITEISDWKGKVLEKIKIDDKKLSGEKVLDVGTSFLISHTLHDNNARTGAFGPSSFLNVKGHPEVSVKTGTTNDRKDNWTIGYTKQILAVVWVGNNDNTSMSGAVSGVSGASPIWNKVMKFALDKSENGEYDKDDDGHSWPLQPEEVVGATICADTGDIRPDCQTRFEYFLAGTIPTTSRITSQDLLIFKDTGQVANSDATPEQVEPQNKPVFTDPLGAIYCMSCPIASSSATIRYPLKSL